MLFQLLFVTLFRLLLDLHS